MANKDKEKEQKQRPPQHQSQQPGRESKMTPPPVSEKSEQRGSGKLDGKIALIRVEIAVSDVRLQSLSQRKGQTWLSAT